MNWFQGILILVGLFVLRVGVPLATMFLVIYLLRRLEAKWQAEA